MDKIKIVLVDDDLSLGSAITLALKNDGHKVHYQTSLAGVEQAIHKINPNIIILDVMVGDDNSLEEINNIKLAAKGTPIIFISSFTDIATQRRATENGAVMFLEKPFTYDKLMLWIERYAKQESSLSPSNICKIGNYTVNTEDHSLAYNGINVKILGNTEYETLRLLIVNQDTFVSREFLKNTVWQGVVCSDESLNNVICRLRKYLDLDSRINIETKRGEGFKLILQGETT